MKDIIDAVVSVATIVGAGSIVVQFLRFVLKKGARISVHLWYLSFMLFCVSLTYVLMNGEVDKLRAQIEILNEHAATLYIDTIAKDIRQTRENNGIRKCYDGGGCVRREYPRAILQKLVELGHLEDKNIRLTADSYYELGLKSYYKEEYHKAVEYGKAGVALCVYHSDALHLICVAYECMGQLDSAECYRQRIRSRQ